MAATAPSKPIDKLPRYRVPGAELFCVGEHNGKVYTHSDLDDIVRNFAKLSTGKRPVHRVPGKILVESKIGHGENQQRDESGMPAAGWISKVWRKGPILFGDIEEMAEEQARTIASRQFRKLSAEIYSDKQATDAGIRGHKGPVLRAASWLGADPPQVKGMADGPMPERYSEVPGGFASRQPARLRLVEITALPCGAFACFSEVSIVDRKQELLQALAKHGIDVGALQGAEEPELAEMLRVCEGKDQAHTSQMAEMKDGEEPGEIAPPRDDKEKEVYREKARKYAERGKKFSERGRKYGERCGMKFDEEPKKPDDKPGEEKFSESRLRDLIRSELSGGVKQDIETLAKFREETIKGETVRTVDSLMDRWSREGRISATPARADATKARLLRADKATVHKFSEQGKEVAGTEFDLLVRDIDREPTYFSEKVKTDGSETAAGDSEVQKVKAAYHRFSESGDLPAGTTEETFVAGFKAAKKHDSSITAEQFTGVK